MSPRQGGDSYPSGTPPYGVPGDAAFSRAGQPPQAGRPGAGGEPPNRDEPRTETTLTTRIKINIPGSRPIPEVVVRSPLNEETGEQPAPRRRRADTSGSPVLGVMGSGAHTGTPPDLPTEWLTPSETPSPESAESGATPPSEWFAPRKKAPASAPSQEPAPGSAPPSPPAQPLFQEPPSAPPAPPASPVTGFEPQQPSQAQAPKSRGGASQPQSGTQSSTGQFPAGQSSTGQFPTGRPPAGPNPDAPPPGYDMPYGSGRDALPDSQPWAGPQGSLPKRPQPSPGQPPQGQTPQTPPGPTLPPRPVPGSIGARLQGAPEAPASSTTGGHPTLQFPSPTDQLTGPQAGRPQSGLPQSGFPSDGFASSGFPPAGAPMPGMAVGAPIATPTSGGPDQLFGQPGRPGQPGGPRSSPKGGQGQQGPKGGTKAGGKAGGGNGGAGQTATMPIPRPQPIADGFAGGTGGAGAESRPEPVGGGTGTGASTASPSGAAKRRGGGKGRKLAGYAVGALVLAGAGAYGAGLMLNQGDVPKGTTVLGYAIGGDTRDQALNTLDHALGPLSTRPITVSVGGKTATLNPSVAGLTIDTTATVDGVAHHDYNPVTVIESLLGQSKAVAPVVTIDPDKLRSALQQLSSTGSSVEASVHFASGKAVVTLPKAGSGLDVDAAIPLVEQAFKNRANGGKDAVVTLSVTTVQPKGSASAANAAADTLGAWAMKQPFKVTAGGQTILFGKNTFSQSLTLRPDSSGAFVPVFNLAKLKAAYGPAFDNAHTKDGRPVTVQDVANALVSLLSKPDGATSITI
jgi:hypothetical protein